MEDKNLDDKLIYYSILDRFNCFLEVAKIKKDKIVSFCSIIDCKENKNIDSFFMKNEKAIKLISEEEIERDKYNFKYKSKCYCIINNEHIIPSLVWNNSFYKNIYDLFRSESIKTRNGKLLDCKRYLNEYVGSITVEQTYNQKNKNSFIFYLNYKQKEIIQVLTGEDIFEILIDLNKSNNQKELENLFEIFNKKEKLILDNFYNNYPNLIKDSLAYRLLGLEANKIKREETKLIDDLFKTLSLSISFDENGNIKYSENTDN